MLPISIESHFSSPDPLVLSMSLHLRIDFWRLLLFFFVVDDIGNCIYDLKKSNLVELFYKITFSKSHFQISHFLFDKHISTMSSKSMNEQILHVIQHVHSTILDKDHQYNVSLLKVITATNKF